jgi:single-strand DNA-binding protein
MANVNKVILIGNLTRDPEVKYTPKGSAVADISLAINRYYSTESGEKREETTYVDVTLWGKTAELAGEYLKKGRSVYVEGRLQLDTWEDKASGQKRSKLRVVGDSIQFLDRKGSGSADEVGYYESHDGESGRPAQRGSASRKESSRPTAEPNSFEEEGEDDIPF